MEQYNPYTNLDTFVRRLKNIGIEVMCASNYPWMYLDSVNGKRVTEIKGANHGFCIGFSPIRNNEPFKFTMDYKTMFNLIRRYAER